MEQRVLKNNKGLTLVEVLISMVVFLLVSLAMMQTALIGIDSNTRNIMRDEAVNIAESIMNQARNAPFESLVSTSNTVRPKIRNIKDPSNSDLDFPFATTVTVTTIPGGDNRIITIEVVWQWRGENYRHSLSTIRKR
jgi:prepilin-type N-terminal cleavage/methylation domain-containing protein